MPRASRQAGWRVPEMPALKLELLAGACRDYGPEWAAPGKRMLRDDFSRLYTLDSGCADVQFADRDRLRLLPGRLYLIPAGTPARYRCPESMRLAWFHVRVEVLPMLDLFARWTPPRSSPCTPAMRATFAQLLDELGTHAPRAAFARNARTLELLQPFLPATWNELLPPGDVHRRLQPALDAMVENIAASWTLSDLARMVHLHPTYFSNLFRETFGVPPLRYLMQLRIRRGRELLIGTDQRIGDVATQCGFRNPLHFSRVFRQVTGLCPRDYRSRGGGIVP